MRYAGPSQVRCATAAFVRLIQYSDAAKITEGELYMGQAAEGKRWSARLAGGAMRRPFCTAEMAHVWLAHCWPFACICPKLPVSTVAYRLSTDPQGERFTVELATRDRPGRVERNGQSVQSMGPSRRWPAAFAVARLHQGSR